MIDNAPGGERLTRPTHLARRLSISEKLAWQIWRVAHASSPAEILAHLPGAQGVEIALAAAAKAGASRAIVSRARQSIEQVDRLVAAHAGGDRASLAMMLAPAGESAGAPARHERGRTRAGSDEEHRRLAFLGTSYLWGVQARTHLSLSILHPGARDDRTDIASIRGVIDMRRLRANLPWIITRTGCRTGSTVGHRDGRWREPLTARSTDPDRAAIIEEFCSSPTPQVRAIPVGETDLDIEIAPTAVGNAGSVTCLVGELLHNLPRYRSESVPRGRIASIAYTPCERWICDLLVHRDAEIIDPLSVSFYGDPRGEGFDRPAQRNRLPIRAAVEYLGRGLDAIETPAIPKYRELILRAHELAGWAASPSSPIDDFAAYRVQLTHPPTPCMALFEFNLPQRPA